MGTLERVCERESSLIELKHGETPSDRTMNYSYALLLLLLRIGIILERMQLFSVPSAPGE